MAKLLAHQPDGMHHYKHQESHASRLQQQQQQQQQSATKSSGDPCCVMLSNLPCEAFEGTIRQAFQQEGIQVVGVQLLQKGSFHRRRSAGLAVVRLASAEEAERSCQLMDGKLLRAGPDAAAGRPLIVRRNKFECDQPAYDAQQQRTSSSRGSSSSSDDSGA